MSSDFFLIVVFVPELEEPCPDIHDVRLRGGRMREQVSGNMKEG
jgi:hypothetical protein